MPATGSFLRQDEGGRIGRDALARELAEELGVTVIESVPWVTFDFDYPHAYVRLHFSPGAALTGTPTAHEGQRLLFHRPGTPAPAPLLPAGATRDALAGAAGAAGPPAGCRRERSRLSLASTGSTGRAGLLPPYKTPTT